MKRLKSFFAILLACVFMFTSIGVNAASVNITSIDSENSSLGYFTNLQYSVVANSVTVSGTAPVGGNDHATVTFWIQQNAATPVDLVYYQYRTGATGAFSLKFTLNTSKYDVAQGSTATLKVGGLGLNTYSATINLYSQAQIDSCRNDFMSIGSPMGKTFAEFFTIHSGMLGITTAYTAQELEIIEKYHLANMPSGSETNDEIVAMIGALGTKLENHKALISAIDTAVKGTNGSALRNIFENTENKSLLNEYYGTDAFDLTGVSLAGALWNRLVNNPTGHTTIESFKTAFDAAKATEISEEAACVAYFKNIDGTVNTLAGFFENYGYLVETNITNPTDIAIFETYYNQITVPPTASVNDVIAIISSLVGKLTAHNNLVAAIGVAALGTDASEVKRILNHSDYSEVVDFVTTENILHESEMWEKVLTNLKNDGCDTLDQIRAAFVAGYNAQKESDRLTGGAVTTDRTLSFLDDWSISNVANKITISGYHPNVVPTNITFHMSGKNGGIDSTDPLKTIMMTQTKSEKYKDSNNSPVDDRTRFKQVFTLNTSRFNTESTGVLRVSAADTNIYQFYVDLYPQAQIDSMISDFKNSVSDATTLNTFIENNKRMLELSGGFSTNKLSIMYELYTEKDYTPVVDPVEVVDELIALTDNTMQVQNFIDSLNNAASTNKYGQVKEVIETTYADLADVSTAYSALISEADDIAYDYIKPVYQAMMDQNIAYTTIKSVKDSLVAAKSAVIPTTPTTPPGGDSGSGGSGGGGGSSTPSGNNRVEFGNDFIVEDQTPEIPASQLPTAPFTDIDGYDWAKTAINNLRQRGIVRGDGDGKFRPGVEMTREEYLSMLFKTYGVDIKSGKVAFGDVNPNEWYADVVATAYNMGITNGVGNNKFGIGQKITRADMVVLAARLAKNIGIIFEQKEAAVIFKDYTTIPDYAYDAVVAFQQANFINGDDDGYFNPVNSTTRAEAAVFFWSIFDYMN